MPRILLVDDDIAEISAVRRVLARVGYQPILATNASDAIATIGQTPPDLLLVGAGCENGEALAMATRLESGLEGVPPMPIVVLGESEGTPAGAVVIQKPLDPSVLLEEVAKALARAPAPEPPAPPPRKPTSTPVPIARIEPGKAPVLRSSPLAQASPPPQARDLLRPPLAQPPDLRPSAFPDPDPGSRRAAAAEALRARAEELRRVSSPALSRAPISEEVVDDELDSLLVRPEEDPTASALDPANSVDAQPAARAADSKEGETADPGSIFLEENSERVEEARTNGGLKMRDAVSRAEAEARQRLEEELRDVRQLLEDERREFSEKLIERARERERVAADPVEELSRLAEGEARARAQAETEKRKDEESELRRAVEKARSEMEELQRRHAEEARRRGELEKELARLTEEAARRTSGQIDPPPLDQNLFEPSRGSEPAFLEEEARRLKMLGRELRSAGTVGSERDPVVEEADALPADTRDPRSPALALPPPELRGGTLVELPAPRLLAQAWRTKLTGRLDFDGDASRSIHFEQGRIVGATSAAPSERIEELALRLGLITRDQHRQVASAVSSLAARRAALVLLERGFLKPNELTGLVRRRAAEIVFGLFVDEEATFRFVGVDVPSEERVGLDRGTLALAVDGVRHRWLTPRLELFLGGPASLLTPVAHGAPPLAELGLSAEEHRVVALADGLRTLDEIETGSPLDSLTTRQVLCALVLVGSLGIRVLGAGRAATLSARAIDLTRVKEKLDQACRADYFTILGVGRLCTPSEVREAAERLSAGFSPARFKDVREEGLADRLEEILRVVRDAREVLADERLRAEYLRGLGE